MKKDRRKSAFGANASERTEAVVKVAGETADKGKSAERSDAAVKSQDIVVVGNARLDADLCPGFVTRDEAVAWLCGNQGLKGAFEELPEEIRQEMIGYCLGENGLPVTRDFVFKKIFDPAYHAEWLESLLTALLGTKVRIVDLLQAGGLQLAEKGSFVIMDVLTELEDIGFADLEMQKVGYQFPLKRSDCYGADVIMRQYNRLRSKMREEKKENHPFDFRQLKPVYCIVISEDSWRRFHEWPDVYVHRRRMRFDSGILEDEKGLREDVYICLDLFRKNPPEITEAMSFLDRWLTFLSETDAGRIMRFLEAFPEFRECYGAIADFVRKPEELMEMYSDILRILDRNSERNMVTDLQGEVEELKGKVQGLKGKNNELRMRFIMQVQKKMKKGKSLTETADDLEVEEGEIEGIYRLIQRLGVDCDAEDILKAIWGTEDPV